METFINYLEFVANGAYLQNFVNTLSSLFTWLFSTVTIFNYEYSIISIIFGNALVVYLTFQVAKFFLPF